MTDILPDPNWCLSQRDVAMLFAGVGILFVFEGAEGGDDSRASVGGLNDRIDEAAFGGDEWIGKAVAELRAFLLPQFFALGALHFRQFALVDDIDRALRTHHGDFGSRPGKV